MHIAIDARTISSTTGRVIERMLHYLQQIDNDNDYTVILDRKDAAYWTPTSPRFTTMLTDAKSYTVAEQVTFARELTRLAPDIVHFCMPQQPIFYRGRRLTTFFDLTLFRSRDPGKGWWRTMVKRKLGMFVFRRAAVLSDRIFVSAAYTRDDLSRTLAIDPAKVIVNYLAADVEPGAIEPYPHNFARYILYVGHQSSYKNIQRLCLAHQQLLKHDPELGLILVGRDNAPVEANRTFVRDNGLRNVVFTGFLPDPQRDWLFANAEAYVFPSLMEGFGLPGLEAMAYGLPVVSSNATCLPEIYGDAAQYFDPLDVQDMARAIGEVIGDQDLRARLVAAGHRRRAMFSWRAMTEATLAAYREVGSQAERKRR
jgi:glycosyltransferase involved in cell wall biosynthesis